MATSTYDPKQVAVIIGAFEISGFSEGSVVSVEYDEDAFSLQIGADGEGTRSKSNNRSATISIKTMQSSDSNTILDAFRKADEYGNAGTFPLMIKDGSGDSLHAAETAWIQKAPSATYDVTATEREWTIRTDNLQSSYGGN